MKMLSIILPTYNEEKNIEHTVTSIAEYCGAKQYPYEIIIIDDGSTDGTYRLACILGEKNNSVSILQHETNRGKGAAVRTGMAVANGEILIFLDADGSTKISELDVCVPFLSQGYGVVIGSRYMEQSMVVRKQPPARIMIGRLGNMLIRFLLLPGIVDTQCGFKVFTKHGAHEIFSRQTIEGWGFDMEILVIARLLGLRIKELPVSWYDATNRASRFRPIKDICRTFAELLLIKTNILLGRYR
ncbi:glycosyltransferase family 2 protein [Candidatus Uhrbacteria bacterium]|nr:glycosyltransferase family 2 protein [Candidatus Uhrbacteria bacterium]